MAASAKGWPSVPVAGAPATQDQPSPTPPGDMGPWEGRVGTERASPQGSWSGVSHPPQASSQGVRFLAVTQLSDPKALSLTGGAGQASGRGGVTGRPQDCGDQRGWWQAAGWRGPGTGRFRLVTAEHFLKARAGVRCYSFLKLQLSGCRENQCLEKQTPAHKRPARKASATRGSRSQAESLGQVLGPAGRVPPPTVRPGRDAGLPQAQLPQG